MGSTHVTKNLPKCAQGETLMATKQVTCKTCSKSIPAEVLHRMGFFSCIWHVFMVLSSIMLLKKLLVKKVFEGLILLYFLQLQVVCKSSC